MLFRGFQQDAGAFARDERFGLAEFVVTSRIDIVVLAELGAYHFR